MSTVRDERALPTYNAFDASINLHDYHEICLATSKVRLSERLKSRGKPEETLIVVLPGKSQR